MLSANFWGPSPYFHDNLSDECKKVQHSLAQTRVERDMAHFGKSKVEATKDDALATVSSLKFEHERDESF